MLNETLTGDMESAGPGLGACTACRLAASVRADRVSHPQDAACLLYAARVSCRLSVTRPAAVSS